MSTPPLVVLFALIGRVTACQPADRRESSRQAITQGSDTGGRASSNAVRVAVSVPCPSDTGQGVTVTRQCFGPMPVDSSLGFLAARFPAYQVDTQLVETTPVLVWYYKVRGDTAMLSQQAGSMDLATPAYDWRIWGEGILLPGGVPLPKTWGELRRRFPGAAYVTGGELGSQVEICALNGVRIDLGFGEDLTGLSDSVPPGTPIGHVVIYPTRRDSHCH